MGSHPKPIGPRFYAFLSPDGARVLTLSGKTVRLWDATTGAELAVLRGHEDKVYRASFSPDGASVLTVYRRVERQLTLIGLTTRHQ